MVKKYIQRCKTYAEFAKAEPGLRADIRKNRVLSAVVRSAARAPEEVDRVEHYLAYHVYTHGKGVEGFLENHSIDDLPGIIAGDLELFD